MKVNRERICSLIKFSWFFLLFLCVFGLFLLKKVGFLEEESVFLVIKFSLDIKVVSCSV